MTGRRKELDRNWDENIQVRKLDEWLDSKGLRFEEKTKFCSKCEKELPIEQFLSREMRRGTRRNIICRTCIGCRSPNY